MTIRGLPNWYDTAAAEPPTVQEQGRAAGVGAGVLLVLAAIAVAATEKRGRERGLL